MARTYFVATQTLPYASALPTDVVVNTFHFFWTSATPPTTAQYNALRDRIKAFYEFIFSGASGVQMAQYARPLLASFKIYDLEDPQPRTPVYQSANALTVGQDTAGNIVPEAAICLSYKAAVVSGQNPARLRGRIYLGALGNTCMATGSATHGPTVTPLAITRITGAAVTLAAPQTPPGFNWCVYSPTIRQQSGSYALAFNAITNGFVDNAFDTQRRRGDLPTTRTLWAA